MNDNKTVLFEKKIFENKELNLKLEIISIDQDNGIVEVLSSSWLHSREIKINDLYNDIKKYNLISNT